MKKHSVAVILMIALVGLLSASGAQAGIYEDAREARKRGDYAAAFRLYKQLADQGDARGYFGLGLMHKNGEGTPQNDAEAVKWYRKGAEMGHAPCQINLGSMYRRGEGVPKDHVEAAKWYRKAAEKGAPLGQFILGRMYATGWGVPQDFVLAHMWINLAAARLKKEETQENASKILEKLSAEMTPAQIAEAQRLAREWKPVR